MRFFDADAQISDRNWRKIADALNDVVDINQKVAKAVDKVSKNIGREGKISFEVDISWLSAGRRENAQIFNLLMPIFSDEN